MAGNNEMKVSIIIPVLNEAELIGDMLKSLEFHQNVGHEVIVIDGGSSDDTVSVADHYADMVLQSDTSRAIQMNHGIQNRLN